MKKGVAVGDDRDEKERRKREKKMRKEGKGPGVSGSMSTEELLRLDEVDTIYDMLIFFWYGNPLSPLTCLTIRIDRTMDTE